MTRGATVTLFPPGGGTFRHDANVDMSHASNLGLREARDSFGLGEFIDLKRQSLTICSCPIGKVACEWPEFLLRPSTLIPLLHPLSAARRDPCRSLSLLSPPYFDSLEVT